MPRRKMPEEEPASEGAPEWMTTYSDLVTLLMCFFVLLFSMAVIDKQKFVEVANSLRSSFQNTQSGGNMFQTNKGNAIVSIFDQNSWSNTEMSEDAERQDAEEKKINEIKGKLEESIESQQLENYVSVIDDVQTVILRIDSTVLFTSGKADIKEGGKEILKKTGAILNQLNNEIVVQGHTDNLPISTSSFPSNWELSTKRATNVVLFLIKNTGMKPEFLTATGNGEYKPIASNDTEAGRQKNRRIDIVIVKNQYVSTD